MTECNGCGDCCDPVAYDVRKGKDFLMKWAAASDPRIDAVWEKLWVRSPNKWKDDRRPEAIRNYLDARWIVDHWHDLGDGDALCDAFDPETRTCLAYDARPPVCSNFPWYNKPPVSDFVFLSDRCSFWADLPEETWPEAVSVTLGRGPRTSV